MQEDVVEEGASCEQEVPGVPPRQVEQTRDGQRRGGSPGAGGETAQEDAQRNGALVCKVRRLCGQEGERAKERLQRQATQTKAPRRDGGAAKEAEEQYASQDGSGITGSDRA